MNSTMTLKEIAEDISYGYSVSCYGNKSTGYISEISFTKKEINQRGKTTFHGGFSFQSGCRRQREMKSLFHRVKKIVPELEIQ